VIEDILYDHRALVALTDILLVQEKNRILRHDGTGEQENCNRQSAFKQHSLPMWRRTRLSALQFISMTLSWIRFDWTLGKI
jgi:hypothetical protein